MCVGSFAAATCPWVKVQALLYLSEVLKGVVCVVEVGLCRLQDNMNFLQALASSASTRDRSCEVRVGGGFKVS